MDPRPKSNEARPHPDADEWWADGVDAAIRSMDAGISVSHEDVRRWVRSWDTLDEIPTP